MGRCLLVSMLLSVAACKQGAEPRCPEPAAMDPGESAEASGPSAARAYEASMPAGNMVPMKVLDVLAVDGGAAVLLREPGEEGRVVPIFIGSSEGTAIALRLEGRAFKRPLTHDLLEGIMRAHDLKVGRVEIHDLIDGTFHGRVVVMDGEGNVNAFDARASDSIAVAMGAGADVFMALHVLNQAGTSPESLGLQPDGTAPPGADAPPPGRSPAAAEPPPAEKPPE